MIIVRSERLNKIKLVPICCIGMGLIFFSIILCSSEWLACLFFLFNIFLALWVFHKAKVCSLLVIVIILISHELVNFTFAFFLPLADDAARAMPAFIHNDSSWLGFSINGFNNYRYALSFFYKLDPSLLLGNELSTSAFLIFCLVFIKIGRHMGLKKLSIPLLIFALWPPTLLWTSVVMREAWELLFSGTAIYFGLLWQSNKADFNKLFFFILFSFLTAFLHRAFPLIVIFSLFLFIYWPIKFKLTVRNVVGTILFFLFMSLVFYKLIGTIYSDGSQVGVIDLVNVAQSHEVATASLHYDNTTTGQTGMVGFLFSMVGGALHYLFGPFPWEIKNIPTFFLVLFAWIRLFFTYRAVKLYRNATGLMKERIGLLLAIYIITVLIWSAGVINYGTAIRHLITSDWIIILLGTYASVQLKKGA